MLPVDRDGTPLMNGVLYGVDTRATREIADLNAMIGEDVILERCRNALTTQAAGPKILWLKRNRPEIYARTHKVLNSTSFIVHRLTGAFTIDHYSAGNSTPFYMADTLDWSDELAPGVIDIGLMPELRWTTDIVGHVTREGRRGNGPCGRNARHRRHHRRGGGSGERGRHRSRPDDGDVWLDHLHHRDHG